MPLTVFIYTRGARVPSSETRATQSPLDMALQISRGGSHRRIRGCVWPSQSKELNHNHSGVLRDSARLLTPVLESSGALRSSPSI